MVFGLGETTGEVASTVPTAAFGSSVMGELIVILTVSVPPDIVQLASVALGQSTSSRVSRQA
ncbi:hypothetical protein BV497_05305 [Fulvimonas soli]|nr:hypothetical protein BV497_05305 [Fulvimonas soli]